MVRLLMSLVRYRMPYPITLVHHDKPDFELITAGHVIAIEAVEAVSQVEAHKSRVIGGLVASGAIPNPLQPVVLRTPNDPPLSNADASRPDKEPHFYGGDEVEINWTGAMKHFIGGKLAKFPSYAHTNEKWLMVYDNWNSISLNLRDGASRVQDWLIDQSAFGILDSVFIIHGRQLVEFTKKGINIRPLRSPK